ncbi:MAG TPA: hypothetical protein IGS40_18910 [Trichormus sp. M33_DOE_039]|nr:hypothetical protein [Trichormus sp. M33_DOE_039]
MDTILERSHFLKQALLDFVLDAEGELAQALEIYPCCVTLGRGKIEFRVSQEG